VGTTTDYIEWIQNTCPGQALFFTDPEVRLRATEPCPAATDELCGDLSDDHLAGRSIESHLKKHDLVLDGIACFDCESMELAAVLAGHFGLSYPSVQAVRSCRDKLQTKRLWRAHGFKTPPAAAIGSAEEAADYFATAGGPVVLKPTSGSGSELVFLCSDARGCKSSYGLIRRSLEQRSSHRLYRSRGRSAEPGIMAEAFAAGQEYSCDFTVEAGRVKVIRLARKIKPLGGPFGTILGYLLPAQLPPMIHQERFEHILCQSAAALGIDRAVCMLDFMIDQDEIALLELAPRPGGDCLPHLLYRGCRLDMLKLQLDFSRGKPGTALPISAVQPLVGLRVLARSGGTLRKVDFEPLHNDPRILEIRIIRQPGHRIVLPPADYDAWMLGHVIFAPDDATDINIQCSSILNRIVVEMT
jgi:biotin carboxylase